ncbi:MAG: FliM/FliN family flagellar motor C-terminal domain-containing protein [Planctomycetota bacterium]
MIRRANDGDSAASANADAPELPDIELRVRALADHVLRVAAVLMEKEVPLEHVESWCEGSILALGKSIGRQVSLRVDGVELGRGTVMERDKQLLLRVDTVTAPRVVLAQLRLPRATE